LLRFKKPGDISEDPLTELLRSGARKLITDAVEVELQELRMAPTKEDVYKAFEVALKTLFR